MPLSVRNFDLLSKLQIRQALLHVLATAKLVLLPQKHPYVSWTPNIVPRLLFSFGSLRNIVARFLFRRRRVDESFVYPSKWLHQQHSTPLTEPPGTMEHTAAQSQLHWGC